MNVIKVFLMCGFYDFDCREVDDEFFGNFMDEEDVEFDEEFVKVSFIY